MRSREPTGRGIPERAAENRYDLFGVLYPSQLIDKLSRTRTRVTEGTNSGTKGGSGTLADSETTENGV